MATEFGKIARAASSANGPDGDMHTQWWPIYQRKFINLTTALAQLTANMFDTALGQSYAPINAVVGTTPNITCDEIDTNLETAGQITFPFKAVGIGVDFGVAQGNHGTVGTATNDLSLWEQLHLFLLNETYLEFSVNGKVWDKFLAVDAPIGAGPVGSFAMGTTAALTTGAAMSYVNNGAPAYGNFRSWSAGGLLNMEANSRFKLALKFSKNCTTTNQAFAPANTAPTVYFKTILYGIRADWKQ